MKVRNFRLGIVMHILLIVGFAVGLAFVIITSQALFIPLALGGGLIATAISLVRFIERTNRNLAQVLMSIRQGAFTETYAKGTQGKPFEELSGAINDIIRDFANLNAEKELHYQYLQALNENINVAILSFDSKGKLIMMNPAAKRLLNFPAFSHADHFARFDASLHDAVKKIKPEDKIVTRAVMGGEISQLSVQAKEIRLNGEDVRIILIQNLNSELEAKEIEAWQQLIRVLTHEIMNSVTPIVSLSAAMQRIMKNPDGTAKDIASLNEENVEDIFSSLATIESRSRGLVKFVKAYKEYAKPIELRWEDTDVSQLISRIAALLKPDLDDRAITLTLDTPPTLPAKADAALVEQVILNLVKNAMEALPRDGSGRIDVIAQARSNNIITISVTDNGPGMDAETMSKIFIPFFTTRSAGSGVGLSLSREIMKMHGGAIRVRSALGKGAAFTVEWRG